MLAALLALDALVVLLGTFGVWLILGFAEVDEEVPTGVSAGAVGLGLLTAALTLLVALGTARGRPQIGPIIAAMSLHLGLAVCAAIALGSPVGTATLVAGATVVWVAGVLRPGTDGRGLRSGARLSGAVLALGVLATVGFAGWEAGVRSTRCDVFAGRTSESGALTLEQGDELERCGVLDGMPRSAVRSTLGAAGLEPPTADEQDVEYYSLDGNRPGSTSFSGCMLVVDYADNRVWQADAQCKED